MTTTLLAVDDSKTMRKVLEITFAGEDYKTTTVASPAEALEAMKAGAPQVALVDANLPDGAGYELCKRIKQASPSTVVLLLANKANPFDKARGATVGVDDAMDKPFDTQQLLDRVAAALKKGAVAPGAGAPAPAPAPAPVAAPAAAAAPRPAGAPVSVARPAFGGGLPPAGAPRAAAAPAPAPAAPAARPAAPVASPAAPAAPAATGAPPSVARPRTATVGYGTAAPAPAPAGATPAARPAPAAAPAPTPAAPAAAPPAAAPAAAAVAAVSAEVSAKLGGLGLTDAQAEAVLALSRELVERVVWEVVPVLAETLIKEEIRRLTAE